MMSIVLNTFCGFIVQITLLLSILLLLRGHNHPGGGFIAALIGCTGMGFYLLAHHKANRFNLNKHILLILLGILCLVLSMSLALVFQKPLLTGLWFKTEILGQAIHLGTPLLFDVGVCFAILGSLLWIIKSIK